uniref:Hexosyltransferase n=1 Tax=Phlebotomus papatasi TaxID=29031 RepID=A0A1B0D0R1_PHLPP
MYPNFATGPIYLLTSDIVEEIYTTALRMPFIWLEDVFLTGFVAEELKIPREELGELGTSKRPKNKLMCHLERLVAVHDVNFTAQYDLWYNLNHPNKTHCTILEEKGSDDLNDALQNLMQQLQSQIFISTFQCD